MSKNRITAAIAVAAVLAVGGTSTLAAAQAASGGPGNDNNDGQVIHLTERDTHTQFTGTFLSNPRRAIRSSSATTC